MIANTWADMLMEQGASPEVVKVPGLSIWFCEILDDYYRGNTDGSLDKKWKLLNGDMDWLLRQGGLCQPVCIHICQMAQKQR